MAWNLRAYPDYSSWVTARNRRIISFLWVGRRFKTEEFKIWVYFEQFLTQKARRWSSFIENFVERLLLELKARGYIRQITRVTVRDELTVTDEISLIREGSIRKPSKIWVEYEVKAPISVETLEGIIYEITPYLDPDYESLS